MRQRDQSGERLHQRVWELLPWYVNDTLTESECRTVEAHAAACPLCREEIASCRRLAAAVRQVPEVAPSPHPAQLARVLAHLDEVDERKDDGESRSSLHRRRSIFRLLAATPPVMRGALAAQLALVVLLAGAWLRQPSTRSAAGSTAFNTATPPLYRTLSDPSPSPVPAASAATARLRLVFAAGTTEEEIRKLLLGIRGQITAGPSPLGVYTVEVPAGPDPLAGVLAHLRAQKQVSLAEPVDGGAGAR